MQESQLITLSGWPRLSSVCLCQREWFCAASEYKRSKTGFDGVSTDHKFWACRILTGQPPYKNGVYNRNFTNLQVANVFSHSPRWAKIQHTSKIT